MRLLRYSDDQPRDDHGRFGESMGARLLKSDIAGHTAKSEQHSQSASSETNPEVKQAHEAAAAAHKVAADALQASYDKQSAGGKGGGYNETYKFVGIANDASRKVEDIGRMKEAESAGKSTDPKLVGALRQWQKDDDDNPKTALAAGRAAKKGDDSNPIVLGIRNETVNNELYRGLAYDSTGESPMRSWEEGQTVQILPASFTNTISIANDFGESSVAHGKDTVVTLIVNSKGSDGQPVHGIEIGTRGLSEYDHEKETITGGKFKIESIHTRTDQGLTFKTIRLTQTGIF